MNNPSPQKRFYNQVENLVQEAIDGLITASGLDAEGNPRLLRLDGYPHTKVILRGDWDKGQVALVSGGGAGHEPAHAGFVGPGMLTAAVSGEIFASPSVDAVLEAILAVTGEAGCLLIVKNYTGDRLNFGLAAERAKQMGLAVEMVIVGDDVAIPGAAQQRGVAGTLFVHKYAGYLAEQGHGLAEIASQTRSFANGIYSLGLSLSSCGHPGRAFEERLEQEEAELGLGIHGEPGRSRIPFQSAKDLVDTLARQLAASLPEGEQRYALLLNNLGSVPPMEMSLILRELAQTPLMEKVDFLFGPAHLMTALDMNGFSVSLAALDPTSQTALLAPVGVANWPVATRPHPPQTLPLSRQIGAAVPASSGSAGAVVVPAPLESAPATAVSAPSDSALVRKLLLQVESALVAATAELNALDGKVGDGDTGSTFARGAKAIASSLDELPLVDTPALFGALSGILSESMGGSSGILLSILFSAAGTALQAHASLPQALQAGIAQMQFYGGAAEGDRTMLDALIPAAAAWETSGDLQAAARAAEAGAASTAAITQTEAGRSSYLTAEALAGVEDPGARAVAIVFKALLIG